MFYLMLRMLCEDFEKHLISREKYEEYVGKLTGMHMKAHHREMDF